MSKAAIATVRKKAQGSVDKAESVISRFARFMGTTSTSLTSDIPGRSTLKKARRFARNFSSGKKSGGLSKALLGSALLLPVVLGGSLSKAKAASTTDVLNQQYGGDERAMRKDLKAEREKVDDGLKNVNESADDSKKATSKQESEINSKKKEEPKELKPKEGEEGEVSEDGEKPDKRKFIARKKKGLDVDAFEEVVDKFIFLSKQGKLFGGGPSLMKRLWNFITDTAGKIIEKTKEVASAINNSDAVNAVRDVIGSEKDDGYLGPKWMGIKNPFANKKDKEITEELTDKEVDEEGEKVIPVHLTKAQPVQTMMGGEVKPQSEMTYDLPPEVAGDEDFMSGIAELSEKYNIPQNDLLAMMDFETGGTFDPATKNMAGSGATGLIQFMPDTAKSLGTTTEELSEMSRAQQLEYVDKYLKTNLEGRIGNEGADISDLYMSVLFPAAVGKPDDFVLFGEGAISKKFEKRYEANKGLDANNDGSITKVEAAAKVIQLRDKNVKSNVSSVGVSPDAVVDGMAIPQQYMSYDTPMAGGGEGSSSVVMIPPNVEKPQMPTQQAFKPNGSGDMDIIFLPVDTNAMISQLTIQSLGAS
tara:strand:+ start:5360 stop:7123 length:1764 start_codon:yes stop_codon:yes gene_type:complete